MIRTVPRFEGRDVRIIGMLYRSARCSLVWHTAKAASTAFHDLEACMRIRLVLCLR